MIKARPQYASQLDFVQINDFDDITDSSLSNIFSEAVKGVDGIIHTASVRQLLALLLALKYPNPTQSLLTPESTASNLQHNRQRERTHPPRHRGR